MENDTMNLNNIANGTNQVPQQPQQTVVNNNQNAEQYYTVPTYTQPVQQIVQQQVNEQAQAQVVQPTQTVVQAPVYQQPVQETPQQPVFTQTVAQPVQETPQAPIENTNIEQPIESVKRQEPQPVVEEVKPVEPITVDNFLIRTEDLQRMINNASKVAICNQAIEITNLVQLMFTKDGLVIRTTDNQNTLTQINRNIKYENEISIGIKMGPIQDLVSKLSTEYVTVEVDESNRIIEIHSGEDEFLFPEQYDESNGQSLVIDDKFNIDGDVNVVVDYNLFKTKVSAASSFMSSSNVTATLSGVYCADKIAATDSFAAYISPNLPELKDYKFYLTDKMLQAINSLSFRNEVTISLKRDESGNIISLSIHDNEMALSGPSNEDIDNFPLEDLTNLVESEQDNVCTISGKEFNKAVQIVRIFMAEAADSGLNSYTISNKDKLITIKDRTGKSTQYVKIKDVQGNLKDLDIKFANLDMSKIISILSEDDVKVSFDEAKAVFICNDVTAFITTKEYNN